ncbi:F-box domain-containing protein [Mycena sanguinolenta]|uniref:F-box domain-containing protein n=1 Tax=Mycena sanguinolenta TaxID=230812 RepID=A0A8H6XWY1_9AGAR|nr:F-box domain-containing protein [Mycena sanguinolenta]
MSSAQSLQARIDELSLAIEHQKQILRDLEKSLSDARRELNAALDPMARLPLEISSEIFVQCLPCSPRPHPREAPTLFLNICRIWRDIATSIPSLWTSVHSGSGTNAMTLNNWLQRARVLPLQVSLSGDLQPEVAIAVNQHASQLEVLKLEFQHLKDMSSPFPSLAELTVIHTTIYLPKHRQCVDILRSAAALVKCEFISKYWWDAVEVEDSYPPVPFTHSSLQNLQLGAGSKAFKSENAAYMLEYLTLPVLRILSISDLDIMVSQFAAFLTRSSPPAEVLAPWRSEGTQFSRLPPTRPQVDGP